MSEFFAAYGLFLAKTITLVVAIIAILATIVALKMKAKAEEKGSLHIEKINEKYDEMAEKVNSIIQSKAQRRSEARMQRAQAKTEQQSEAGIQGACERNKCVFNRLISRKKNPTEPTPKKRLFVTNFDGDIKASAVDDLRETITAILLTATPQDHVLLKLESGGGMVHGYGLASSQLQRLRDAKIPLTVSIDKVAASGGYMMACVANTIIAAPFAIIGSIGVVAQLPNFHKLLEKNNIEFEQITAGEYKRTLTMFGKNTSEGREKLQDEINETHELFKSFVKAHREQIDIDAVATGEHWFATQCIEKKLVDILQTSDDYLLSRKDDCDIYEIVFSIKQPLTKRLGILAQNTLHALLRTHA